MVCIWLYAEYIIWDAFRTFKVILIVLFAVHLVPIFFVSSFFSIVRQQFHILLPLYLCGIGRGDRILWKLENNVSWARTVQFSINFNAQCVSYRYIRRQFQIYRHHIAFEFRVLSIWDDVVDRISELSFFFPLHSFHSLFAIFRFDCCLTSFFRRVQTKEAQNSGRNEQQQQKTQTWCFCCRCCCCCCYTQERKCIKTNINVPGFWKRKMQKKGE